MNPVQYSDLFDDSGSIIIEKAITYFEQLNKVYLELAKNSEKYASQISDDLNNIAQASKSMTDSVQKATGEGLSKMEKQVADLEKQMGSLKQTMEAAKRTEDGFSQKAKDAKDLADAIKAAKEAEKERVKAIKDAEKAAKEQAKTEKENQKRLAEQNSAYAQASKRLNEIRKEYKDLAVLQEQGKLDKSLLNYFKELEKEVKGLDKLLKEVDESAGQYQRTIGNYAKAFQGFTQGAGLGDVASLGGAFGLGAKAGALAVDFLVGKFQELRETVKEINKQLNNTAIATGLEGEQLGNLVAVSRVLATNFEQSQEDIVAAANTLAKEYGVSFEEAIKSVQTQLIGGVKDLDISKEYATQLKSAGVSLQEFTNLNVAASRAGLYQDKAADSIKEIALRLGDLTPAQDAVLKSLGKTGDEIKNAFASGDKIGAVEALVKEINRLEDAGINAQPIISNLGGGALEDLGRKGREVIASFRGMNIELTETQKRIAAQIESQTNLSKAQVQLAQAFKSSGQDFSIFANNLEANVINKITESVLYIQELEDRMNGLFGGFAENPAAKEFSNFFAEIFDFFIDPLGTGFTTIDDIIDLSITAFEELQAIFRGLEAGFNRAGEFISQYVENIKAEFPEAVQFITDLIDTVGDAINTVENYLNSIINDTGDAFISVGNSVSQIFNEIVDSVTKIFDGVVNSVLGAFNDVFSYLQNIFPSLKSILPKDVLETFNDVFKEAKAGYDFAKASQKAGAEQSKQVRDELAKQEQAQNKTTEAVNKTTEAVNKTTEATKKAAAANMGNASSLKASEDAAKKAAEAQKEYGKEIEKLANDLAKSEIEFQKLVGNEDLALALQFDFDEAQLEKQFKETEKLLREKAKAGGLSKEKLDLGLRLNTENYEKELAILQEKNSKAFADLADKRAKELDSFLKDVDKTILDAEKVLGEQAKEDEALAKKAEELDKEEVKRKEEERKAELAAVKEQAEKIFDIAKEYIDKQAEARQALLDGQIESQKALLDAEVKLAETTGQRVDLAGREQQIADLENQKLQAQQEKIRLEEVLTFFKILTSYLTSENPENALVNSIRDFGLAKAFSGSFFVGGFNEIEGLNKSGSDYDSFVTITHGNEYISPAKQVRELRPLFDSLDVHRQTGIFELPEIYAKESATLQIVSPTFELDGNDIAKKVGREVADAMKGQLEVTNLSVDSLLNIIEQKKKGNNTNTTIHKRRISWS